MRKLVVKKAPRLANGFPRRMTARLEEIQQELGPSRLAEFVMINTASGEYVVGRTPEETIAEYDKRWPHGGFFACRADGGPFSKG